MNKLSQCTEVWGGNKNVNTNSVTEAFNVSLLSISSDGDKGGDFYFFSKCEKGHLGRIIIGDVVGHGDAVSDISGWVYDEMSHHASSLESNTILHHLNQAITERGLEAMTTATVISYCKKNLSMYYCYAGHYPALIRKKDESDWKPAAIKDSTGLMNLPLGVQKSSTYSQHCLHLDAEDSIFLYTDGLIEARDKTNKEYGYKRLLENLNNIKTNQPDKILTSIHNSLMFHCSSNFYQDDITIIAAQIQ
jgi:sigma-B regulation protein RsbU (phosphoserine phosphatase)